MKEEHPYKVFAIVPDVPSHVVYPIDMDRLEKANERHLKGVSERNKKQIPEELYNICKESL